VIVRNNPEERRSNGLCSEQRKRLKLAFWRPFFGSFLWPNKERNNKACEENVEVMGFSVLTRN
jgi:hypothetical protein